MAPSALILGIDPSTTATGVALLHVPLQGELRLIDCRCVRGGAGDYIQRLRVIASEVAAFPGPVDLVAIEEPFSKPGQSGPRGAGGGKNMEMVWALIGAIAYVVQEPPLEMVSANTVAAQFKASGMARGDKKQAAVEWARQVFGMNLGDKDHDAAEAIAVACAAGQKWRERAWASQQTALKLGGRAKR